MSFQSSNELVKKLTDLDELIDAERRRWKQQVCVVNITQEMS
jgi:hypothetical protein